jgi:hypothetical protein
MPTKFTVERPSTFLFQFIRDCAHDLTALTVDPEPPAQFPHADPYLLSSAMQKAIRRGNLTVARRAGHQLLPLDRARLWRRLALTFAYFECGASTARLPEIRDQLGFAISAMRSAIGIASVLVSSEKRTVPG